jgi:hypothetical protein
MKFVVGNSTTFQYSRIDVEFIDGFGCSPNRKKCLFFYCKKERVSECIELIYELNELYKKKLIYEPKDLTKEEIWEYDYLHKRYKDSRGLFQGKYEIFSEVGKLVAYGNYKDNGKIGIWQEDFGSGRSCKGEYVNDHRVGTWVYNNGKTNIYNKHGFWIGGDASYDRFEPSAYCGD